MSPRPRKKHADDDRAERADERGAAYDSGEAGEEAAGDDADAIEAELVTEAELEGDAEPGEVAPRVGRARPSRETERAAPLARYDPLQAYMRDVQRYPLLTPQEEHDAAVRYYTQGDLDAAAKLVTANLRLVVKIAY